VTKTIVITSGKGGVGKTNISVNTALELSRQGFRTCLLDADFGLANVDILLGLQPEKTLNDVICGDQNLEDIILHSEAGIDIIPGSSGIEKIANLTSEKISELVSAFSQLTGYDYFLIDTSSGISKGVISFCLAGTETIVVITSEATSLIDAYSLIKVMAANSYQGTVKILVNKCPDIPTSKRTYGRFKKAVDTYLKIKIAFAGVVLHDPNIEKALKDQEPLLLRFPDSVASQCIRSVVSILLSNKSLEQSTVDFGVFWKRYFDLSSANLSIPENPQDNSEASEPASAAETDENRKSHEASRKSEPEAIDADEELVTPPLSGKTLPKNSIEQPAQQEIRENTAEDVTHLSKMEQPREDEREALSSPDLDKDIPTANPEMTSLASPLPILVKCLELLGKGALSQSDLMNVFTCDPALMLRVLRIFSSLKQRRGQRLRSILDVLQEVGPETLSSLLTQATLQRAFNNQATADTDFANQFWCHSYKTALIAQNIARAIEYPYPDEAFLAGLIHDIGRLSLQSNSPELYKQFPDSFHQNEQLLEAEKKAFGVHHAELGAATLRDWNVSSFISDAVQYHTESPATIETAFDLVKIIYVASRLTQLAPERNEATIELGLSLLQLSQSQLQSCLSQSEAKVVQSAAYFKIPLTREIDTKTIIETQNDFRDQAMEYSLLQGMLPSPVPKRSLSQIITRIHQGLSILFNIQQAICLLPDEQLSCLQAVGYPNCWAEEILSDITFSFQSAKSAVLEAFSTGTVKFVTANDPAKKLPLGDKQLLSYFGSCGLVCVPMVESGKSVGVIILGFQEDELVKSKELQRRFVQFGAQSARNLLALERISGLDETKSQSSSAQMRDIKKDLFG
jgi:flagellar biosynthesis protein FlhG